MAQNSNVCFIKGHHMHQNFIWKNFEHLRHIQSVQDFVLIVIYFVVLLLGSIEFGRIFELYEIHWINQNWLTILHVSLKSILPYTAKHLFYQIIIQEHVLITLFLLFWHQTLKIRLIFMPKYRGHFLSSHAKICVTCPIMPMLI